MKKKILVACGTGIATSTVVTDAVENLCKDNGIACNVIQCKITEVPGYAEGTDLLVTTTIVKKEFPFPVINGKAFLTTIGLEEVKQQILDALK